MEELSIEEKTKRYDEALERAKKLQETCDSTAVVGWCEYIFPELKESEDEEIRKWLINEIKIKHHNLDEENIEFVDKAIAWLKKQDKWRTEDKFEPKFHKGDWIIFNENRNSTYQVERIGNYRYYLRHYLGGTLSVPFDSELIRLWTIQDAKDGDVLACESGWICIFKALVNDENFSSYCFMDSTKWFCEEGSECHTLNKEFMKAYNGEIKPATKEQRDLLFAKMKEAGYEWDSEKKELKKIEQNSVDNVEPKFHEGQWLCENELNNYARFIQILEIVNVQGKERYRISRDIHNDEDIVEFNFVEKYYHKFDIQDANDGDLIYVSTEVKGIQAIFHKFENGIIYFHCNLCGDFTQGGYEPSGDVKFVNPLPKTHYQRFFQKMKEACYEWDAESKELKKIEVVSKGSKDEKIRKAIKMGIRHLEHQLRCNMVDGVDILDIYSWLDKQDHMLDPDKVIEWLRKNTCAACWDNPDEGVSQRIEQFKKDFGL